MRLVVKCDWLNIVSIILHSVGSCKSRLDAEQGEGEHSGHRVREEGRPSPFIYLLLIAQFFTCCRRLVYLYLNWTVVYTQLLWKWRSQTARRSFLRTCLGPGKLSRCWRAEGMLKVKASDVFLNASLWTEWHPRSTSGAMCRCSSREAQSPRRWQVVS